MQKRCLALCAALVFILTLPCAPALAAAISGDHQPRSTPYSS